MHDRFLYYTTIPILLDGTGTAGRLAKALYCRHGVTAYGFCPRRGLLLSLYAHYHHTLPYTSENDGVILRLLDAFARDKRNQGGILLLIPCSPEAQAFLERVRPRLEENFVMADLPSSTEDPLGCLIRGGERA